MPHIDKCCQLVSSWFIPFKPKRLLIRSKKINERDNYRKSQYHVGQATLSSPFFVTYSCLMWPCHLCFGLVGRPFVTTHCMPVGRITHTAVSSLSFTETKCNSPDVHRTACTLSAYEVLGQQWARVLWRHTAMLSQPVVTFPIAQHHNHFTVLVRNACATKLGKCIYEGNCIRVCCSESAKSFILRRPIQVLCCFTNEVMGLLMFPIKITATLTVLERLTSSSRSVAILRLASCK